GIEYLGIEGFEADVECIALAQQTLKALGLGNKVQLELNTLGDFESRKQYTEKLVEYLSFHQSKLSRDSQRRLQQNPLRILDSKDEADQLVVRRAPKLSDFLSPSSIEFYRNLKQALTGLNIAFRENPL